MTPNTPAAALPPPRQRLAGMLPWLALAIALVLTLLVWRLNSAAVEHEARDHFEHRAIQLETALRNRMRAYQTLLQGGAGLFAASREVDGQEWRAYVESLNLGTRHPGILGMGHIRLVPGGTGGAAGALHFLEPLDPRDRHLLGHDMLDDPARRAAMLRARDSGEPSLSGKIRLLQATNVDEPHGFHFYVPVYRRGAPLADPTQRRAALTGWVYASFRMETLMRDIFERDAGEAIDLEIFDGDTVSPATELYDSDASGRLFQTTGHTPFASRTSHLDLGGHRWTLVMHSLPGFESGIHSLQPAVILAAGALISLLLFAFTRNLTTTRARAETLAREKTAALVDSESRYRQMFESNRSVKLIIDPSDGRIVEANPAAAAFYGYSLAQLGRMKIGDINTLPPETLAAEMAAARAEQRLYFNFKHRLANGDVRDVEVFTGPVRERTRTLLYSVIHDVTERNRTLAEQRAILDNAVVGIALLRGRNFIWANPKLEQMFGYAPEDLIGHSTLMLYTSREDFDRIGAEGYAVLSRGEHYQTECRMRRKDGGEFWVYVSGKLLDPAEPAGDSIWILLDISAQRAAQEALVARGEELHYLSLHDPLTGLYNRRHMDEVLSREVQLARRKARSLTAIMLDIDHFKRFNDQFGHEVGDHVLREVSRVLAGQVRETDVACRYGGEEFLLLLPESTLETAVERAETLRLHVRELKLEFERRALGAVTISLGVAELPEHAANGDALVAAADAALYAAKRAGRDRVVAYDPAGKP